MSVKVKKGDRVHIRVFNPIVNQIIGKSVEFDEEHNLIKVRLADNSVLDLPAHTVHHIYGLNSSVKVHCHKNIECARHYGVYKGRKIVGGLSYMAFAIDGVPKLSYFLEEHVSVSRYEEAKL